MTARIIPIGDGAVVVQALLSEWQAVGRFLHVRLSDGDRTLTMTGLSVDEAKRLADRVNHVAGAALQADMANRVRRPFSLLQPECHA